MLKKTILSILGCIYTNLILFCNVIHVGSAYPVKTITQAASLAHAGDSIMCHDAIIQGGMAISNLKGSEQNYIYLLAEKGKSITIQGGANSIQFSDCSYLQIEDFIIQGQTGNGMNIDDAGSIESPTHHIKILRCTFRNINATGNNDLLKLSGLDFFDIRNCNFENGAAGGSGIDMVGCHFGVIVENNFKNLGSNSIQAKGGSANLEILRNQFENGGARALNLGGSTGLQFFRPIDATTEAEQIKVLGNVFQGSEAAIAFVGCRKVNVSNNTILFPKKWVIRILQETVDPMRFLPCGDNQFFNNIVVVDNAVSIEANIGPNTEPATFSFTKNLWYKTTNANWQGPNLPGTIIGQIIANPQFILNTIFQLKSSSPAIGAGLAYSNIEQDILGNNFNTPPSIGAHEGNPLTTAILNEEIKFQIFPNPFDNFITCFFGDDEIKFIIISDVNGREIKRIKSQQFNEEFDTTNLNAGIYILSIETKGLKSGKIMVKN